MLHSGNPLKQPGEGGNPNHSRFNFPVYGTRCNMPPLMLILLALVGQTQTKTIMEFQDRLAGHSRIVEPALQLLRAENNRLRLELIHQVIPRMANLTVDLRQLTWDSWDRIENHEKANEDCVEQMRYLFNVYVASAETLFTSLAQEMYWELRDDARYRFNPDATFMGRENIRATHQTVQTLGRNRFVDNLGDTIEELQDELDYHEALWVGYEVVLAEELEAIRPKEKYIIGELDWWHEAIMEYHKDNMDSLIGRIDDFCWIED